jgi:hypothetical protein
MQTENTTAIAIDVYLNESDIYGAEGTDGINTRESEQALCEQVAEALATVGFDADVEVRANIGEDQIGLTGTRADKWSLPEEQRETVTNVIGKVYGDMDWVVYE